MKEKRTKSREDAESDAGRRWVVEAQPKPKTSPAVNTLILVVILAALCVVAYLSRARIGAFWEQVTGKAPPLRVTPEKPERDGPEIEGRDF
jgi:fatty acid desaturase